MLKYIFDVYIGGVIKSIRFIKSVYSLRQVALTWHNHLLLGKICCHFLSNILSWCFFFLFFSPFYEGRQSPEKFHQYSFQCAKREAQKLFYLGIEYCIVLIRLIRQEVYAKKTCYFNHVGQIERNLWMSWNSMYTCVQL